MPHVHRAEKIWLVFGFVILAVLLVTITTSAVVEGFVPPSHIATIDPTRVSQTPPFDKPGLRKVGAGVYEAYYVAHVFSFDPPSITVPAGARVTFFVTSTDVEHGFYIPGTDVNTMVTPGWVSTVTHVFKAPGRYLVACHEYCGIAHQTMSGSVEVR